MAAGRSLQQARYEFDQSLQQIQELLAFPGFRDSNLIDMNLVQQLLDIDLEMAGVNQDLESRNLTENDKIEIIDLHSDLLSLQLEVFQGAIVQSENNLHPIIKLFRKKIQAVIQFLRDNRGKRTPHQPTEEEKNEENERTQKAAEFRAGMLQQIQQQQEEAQKRQIELEQDNLSLNIRIQEMEKLHAEHIEILTKAIRNFQTQGNSETTQLREQNNELHNTINTIQAEHNQLKNDYDEHVKVYEQMLESYKNKQYELQQALDNNDAIEKHITEIELKQEMYKSHYESKKKELEGLKEQFDNLKETNRKLQEQHVNFLQTMNIEDSIELLAIKLEAMIEEVITLQQQEKEQEQNQPKKKRVSIHLTDKDKHKHNLDIIYEDFKNKYFEEIQKFILLLRKISTENEDEFKYLHSVFEELTNTFIEGLTRINKNTVYIEFETPSEEPHDLINLYHQVLEIDNEYKIDVLERYYPEYFKCENPLYNHIASFLANSLQINTLLIQNFLGDYRNLSEQQKTEDREDFPERSHSVYTLATVCKKFDDILKEAENNGVRQKILGKRHISEVTFGSHHVTDVDLFHSFYTLPEVSILNLFLYCQPDLEDQRNIIDIMYFKSTSIPFPSLSLKTRTLMQGLVDTDTAIVARLTTPRYDSYIHALNALKVFHAIVNENNNNTCIIDTLTEFFIHELRHRRSIYGDFFGHRKHEIAHRWKQTFDPIVLFIHPVNETSSRATIRLEGNDCLVSSPSGTHTSTRRVTKLFPEHDDVYKTVRSPVWNSAFDAASVLWIQYGCGTTIQDPATEALYQANIDALQGIKAPLSTGKNGIDVQRFERTGNRTLITLSVTTSDTLKDTVFAHVRRKRKRFFLLEHLLTTDSTLVEHLGPFGSFYDKKVKSNDDEGNFIDDDATLRMVISLHVDFEQSRNVPSYWDIQPIAYAVSLVKRLNILKKETDATLNHEEIETVKALEEQIQQRLRDYGRRNFNVDRLGISNVRPVFKELYDLNLRTPYGAMREVLLM